MPISFYLKTPNTEPTYEDLSTWEEYESNGNYITVDGTSWSVTTIPRPAISTIRKNFGANYFTDFEIEGEFNYTYANDNGSCCYFALTNGQGTLQDMIDAGSGLAAFIYREGTTNRYFLQTFHDSSNDQAVFGSGHYYWNISRTGTTASLKFYSNSERTTLIDTVTVTCPTNFSHMLAVCSRDGLGSGVVTMSGDNYKIITP